MDYVYHNNYTKERQWLQDSIIDKLLSEIVTGEHDRENEDSQLTETQLDVSTKKMCTMPVDPWLIYVAGTEMSNRSMTIKKLLEINEDDSLCNDLPRFPILGFVLVDSREIRSLLPEHQCYLQNLKTSNFGPQKFYQITKESQRRGKKIHNYIHK